MKMLITGGHPLVGEITVSGGNVPGYIFSGRNGLSSGSSTAYVGRAGTNRPGATVATFYIKDDIFDTSGNEIFAKPGPNDWVGTYSHTYFADYGVVLAPGAGGKGALYGGGGGAGYCGGSGGIMQEQLIAEHVGGGGGGSSFLKQEVNGKKVQFEVGGDTDTALDDETADMLSHASGCPSHVGGAIALTYLGKKKYAEVEAEIIELKTKCDALQKELPLQSPVHCNSMIWQMFQ